jgi:hypothetical protein
LSAVLFWQISANICVCCFIAFFWVLLIIELLGSCYSSICYICGGFGLKPEAKRGWLYVMPTLMLLIELCLVLYEGSFQVWRLENNEMSWRMDKSSSLGMPMHYPKKYPRSTSVKAWGCPRGTPSSSAKIRSPFKTPHFYCFMHYMFFLER